MKKITKIIVILLILFTECLTFSVKPVSAQSASGTATDTIPAQTTITNNSSPGSFPALPSNYPPLLLPRHRDVMPVLNSQSLSGTSAIVNTPLVLNKLSKKNFRTDEDVAFSLANSQNHTYRVAVLNAQNLQADVAIDQETSMDNIIYYVSPRMNLRPGRYKIQITDESGKTTEQDFTWGVLAINPNKSVYAPHEDAFLSMAVLDETGNMVCDAKVSLQITDTAQGISDTLSTDNGKITVNADQCKSHVVTLIPDYYTHYQTQGPGTYDMTLTAIIKNGTYTISDSFEVRASVPFSVERLSATRIYPPNTYPVQLNITANRDFTGKISEVVPANFTISQFNDVTPYDTLEKVAIVRKGKAVLGASVGRIGMPFTGDYPVSLGFGEHLVDTKEKDLYARFGLMGHDGMDFAMPIGTPLQSVDDGTVSLAGQGPYGTTIIIQHSWGQSYYGHLSVTSVAKGQTVKRGDQIGLSGNTGIVTGPHLHFSIKPDKNDPTNGFYGKIDPAIYLGLKEDNTAVLGASTNALPTDDVQVLTWKVNVKAGDKLTLGYNYVAPNASPQFYTIGPATFYSDNDQIAFQETRPWQIAVDAAQTFYMLSTAGSGSYPTTSWLYSTTNNSSSNVTTFAENHKNAGFWQFQPGVDNTTSLGTTASSLPTTITNKGWVYNSTVLNNQYVASGTWTINYNYSVTWSGSAPTTKDLWYRVLRVTCTGGSCSQQSVISPTDGTAPANSGWSKSTVGTIPASGVLSGAQSLTFSTASPTQFGSSDTLYVEFAINTSSTGTNNNGGWHLEANTNLDSIVTPNVYVPTYTQGTYRWYQNKDNIQPDTAYRTALENTAVSLKQQSNSTDMIRLRMNQTVGSGDLPASNQQYTLQVATSSAGPWIAVGGQTSAYAYRKKITIPAAQVQGTSDLTNFPVLITESSDTDLKSAANGGFVQNSSGYDIAFYASDGTTKLDHEIEKYVATTGEIEMWVRIPTLSHTVDNVIYLYFDNNNISTSQENITGVWDSNYKSVWHLKETPPDTTPKDSTSNGNNGTYVLPWATYQQTTGIVDGALQFQATRSADVTFADVPSVDNSSFLTLEMWYKPTTINASGFDGQLYTSSGNYHLETLGTGDCSGTLGSTIEFQVTTADACSGNVLTAGTWTHVVAAFDGTKSTDATKVHIYINGRENTPTLSGPFPATTANSSQPITLGLSSATSTYTNGTEDEVRISNVARQQNWVTTEFNNMATPSAFETFTAKQTLTSSYVYRKKFTIDHTKVSGGSDLTNFPVLISESSDSDLKSAANGGFVQNSNGYDMVFRDSTGSAQLDHEIEKYVATTGEIEMWVRIPTLSASVDTVIYLYYDNSGISASQENIHGVWNSNYKGVWHLGESSGTPNDSTSYASNGSITGGVTQGASGKFATAYSFDGSTGYVTVANPGDSHLDFGTNSFTFSHWVYMNGAPSVGNFYGTLSKGGETNGFAGYDFSIDENPKILGQAGNSTTRKQSSAYTLSNTTWTHVVTVVDRISNLIHLYANGSEVATGIDISAVTGSYTSTYNLVFGRTQAGSYPFNGRMQEARVINGAESPGWITTEYNNQNSPSTFYTIGASENLISGTWAFYNNPTPVDGTQVTTNLLSTSTVSESYQESNPTVLNPAAIASGGTGEWDFSLDPSNATPGTRYYFRMVLSDGTATQFTYNVYPNLLTAPSLDMFMRHRQWFSNDDQGDKVQPFDL